MSTYAPNRIAQQPVIGCCGMANMERSSVSSLEHLSFESMPTNNLAQSSLMDCFWAPEVPQVLVDGQQYAAK
jgi:hypothetical protein